MSKPMLKPISFEEWMRELADDAAMRGLANALSQVPEKLLRRLWRNGAAPSVSAITRAYLDSAGSGSMNRPSIRA